MKYGLILIVLGCLVLSGAQAQPKAGPAPKFAVIESTDPAKGTLVWQEQVPVPQIVQKAVPKTVTVNGVVMTVFETVNETVMAIQTINTVWSAETNRVYDGAGNPLTKEALFQRLKAGDAVLLLNGLKLDPAYQRLLSKEAVVLVIAMNPAN